MNFELHLGDCIESMRKMADASVDSIVTDPPYELGFMGKTWDASGIAYNVEMWREALRVLKPGGHLLAFSGSRTYHRMVCAIEDAGFEIRDQIMWVYGSGFPKSLDVSKAIDGQVLFGGGNTRQLKQVNENCPGEGRVRASTSNNGIAGTGGEAPKIARDEPATDAARQWQGWGTALKPAHEPIVVARKPLIGTVAANVLAHGTGAMNIDGCRVACAPGDKGEWPVTARADERGSMAGPMSAVGTDQSTGRWPANLIHDGSGEVLAAFPGSNGSGPARKLKRGERADGDGWGMGGAAGDLRDAGTGSTARFFYCAKASKADRSEGNVHPTVKPTDLMRYLCRLVTPPGGTVLDPFMGSGSTGKAAALEGFRFIGCELSSEYLAIAHARIGDAAAGGFA